MPPKRRDEPVVLSRIYTRTGDDGSTALANGDRAPKTDRRLAAYADVEEANCAIGVAITLGQPSPELTALLGRVQNEMFDVGADLANPISDQVSNFQRQVPHYVREANNSLAGVQRWLDRNHINVQIKSEGETALQTLGERVGGGAKSVVSFTRDALVRAYSELRIALARPSSTRSSAVGLPQSTASTPVPCPAWSASTITKAAASPPTRRR